MQTFLPYPDLQQSVMVLDPKRLGNQVYRECKTLVGGGWANHPASKMWRGHEFQLCQYALLGLEELQNRGKHYPHHVSWFLRMQDELPDTELPEWFGDERVHSSHRAALLYKYPEWYGQFGWSEEPAVPNAKGSLPYFWPV